MPKIKFFIISCSSDQILDTRKLYVWGETETSKWMPETSREAERRIELCHKKMQCQICDAEIHRAEIVRMKETCLRMQESIKKVR